MKPIIPTMVFITLGLLLDVAWSRPVDLSAPSEAVGAANPQGYLEIWRQIDDVGFQLGTAYLPFRYRFSSDPSVGGMLGPGFSVPMFEARNVLIREQMMEAFLPCGKSLYLRRSPTDQNSFQTVDQVWKGYLDRDDFTIWRDDGWKLIYHKNRLTSLSTDDNHTFTWSYDAKGLPANISKDGQSVIAVEPNATGQVAAFLFKSKRYEVEYAQRPVTQILMGQIAIKELDPALSIFKYPNGTSETFKIELTSDRVPKLTFSDTSGQKTVYTWDASTNYLVSEKGSEDYWTYVVGPITQKFGLPPITRSNEKGQSESLIVDNNAGTTTQTALDGEVTVKTVFKTPGPLYGKLRQITDSPDKNTSILIRFGYDERGRLARKIDNYGFITTYIYDANGKVVKQIVSPPSDPAIVSALQSEEKVYLSAITRAITSADKDYAIDKLAMFYIYRVGNINKALALVKGLAHTGWGYEIKLQAILGNNNLTSIERVNQLKALLVDYPEARGLISSEINVFQVNKS